LSRALAVADFSKTRTARIISDSAASFHPMPSHRILYVGRDLTLLNFLNSTLKDCFVVRSLGGSDARLLIESNINYSLLLFDDELLDMTGADLAQFARRLAHCEHTPIVIFEKSDNLKSLVDGIVRLLR
jgi:DNA-binding response OmpR family regulator